MAIGPKGAVKIAESQDSNLWHRPYITSWTRPIAGDRLYLDAPDKDELLLAFSLGETDPKSAISPL